MLSRFEERRRILARLREERANDIPSLESLGFSRVGDIKCVGDRVTLNSDAPRAAGVYAFAADLRVIRVGSSVSSVDARLRGYPGYINSRLADPDGNHVTPLWEAELWVKILRESKGEIWSRVSEPVESAIGFASEHIGCKVEEFLVSQKFAAPGLKMPVLNRSSRIS